MKILEIYKDGEPYILGFAYFEYSEQGTPFLSVVVFDEEEKDYCVQEAKKHFKSILPEKYNLVISKEFETYNIGTQTDEE